MATAIVAIKRRAPASAMSTPSARTRLSTCASSPEQQALNERLHCCLCQSVALHPGAKEEVEVVLLSDLVLHARAASEGLQRDLVQALRELFGPAPESSPALFLHEARRVARRYAEYPTAIPGYAPPISEAAGLPAL